MQRVIIYYDYLFTRANLNDIRPIQEYASFCIAEITPEQKRSLLERSITLQEYDLDQLTFGETLLDKEQLKFSAGGKDRHLTWIVQFVGPIKETWKERLQEMGARLFGDLHPYAIFAYMHPSVVARVKKEHYIYWIGRYKKHLKIHPGVGQDVVTHYFPWTERAESHGLHRGKNRREQEELAKAEDLFYIEPYLEPLLFNLASRVALNVADTIHETGTGEIVAITDTGIYQAHEAFSAPDKIAAIIDVAGDASVSGGDGDGHGTHVACSVAGQNSKYDGQGSGARLISVKVFNNNGYWAAGNTEYTFWKNAYLQGAKINNNSWGSNSRGYYSSTDRNADRISSEMRDCVLSIAAGNSGPSISTVGSPGCSKNAITVGACVTGIPETMASFSSRGPTRDKRIKPDVIAPGASVTSAKAGTISEYVAYQGTSMATPQISGVISLIRQHFREKSSALPNPSSALIKALLINGAVEMTGSGSDSLGEKKFPNNSQGWGRVDVSRSLPFADLNRRFHLWDLTTAPTTGNKWIAYMNVDAGAKMLKWTLAWIDAPGTVGSSINLVNNFNLRVITPNGTIFLGNNFSGLNPSYSVPGGSFDFRNNVEGIHLLAGHSLPTLSSGHYQVEVISSNTSSVNVGFALVLGIDSDDLAPVPEPIRIAVMGDYLNQLKTLLEEQGYQVDSFQAGAYTSLNSNLYKAVVLNQGSDSNGFDALIDSGVGIIFLGPYPSTISGLGLLSRRTLNPTRVTALWNKGPVKVVVSQTHPIFGNRSVGTTITVVNGGDNDYQSYDGFTGGQNIGSNGVGSGYPMMISVRGKQVLLGILGVTNYTNLTHWTPEGIEIFKGALKSVID